jgi:hypothetical protein
MPDFTECRVNAYSHTGLKTQGIRKRSLFYPELLALGTENLPERRGLQFLPTRK